MAEESQWTKGELLGFDLETTGIDPRTARPVSYALVRRRRRARGPRGDQPGYPDEPFGAEDNAEPVLLRGLGQKRSTDHHSTRGQPLRAGQLFGTADAESQPEDRDAALEIVHCLVDPGCEIPAGATAIHHITTEQARRDGIDSKVAIGHIVEALLAASSAQIPLVGMNLRYDLTIVDLLARNYLGSGLRQAGWHGPVLDALVLDRHFDRYRRGSRRLVDLCQVYGVRGKDLELHGAAVDAAVALSVVLALAERYDLGEIPLAQLTEDEAAWHREWATSFNSWQRSHGKEPLSGDELSWPLPPEPASSPR